MELQTTRHPQLKVCIVALVNMSALDIFKESLGTFPAMFMVTGVCDMKEISGYLQLCLENGFCLPLHDQNQYLFLTGNWVISNCVCGDKPGVLNETSEHFLPCLWQPKPDILYGKSIHLKQRLCCQNRETLRHFQLFAETNARCLRSDLHQPCLWRPKLIFVLLTRGCAISSCVCDGSTEFFRNPWDISSLVCVNQNRKPEHQHDITTSEK